MTSSSPTSSAIAVDANLVVRAVLPANVEPAILERFASWRQSQVPIIAPDILLPEAVSVIRRGVFDRWISEAEGRQAVDDLFRLGVEIIPGDISLCQDALAWAGQLGQSRAYDGFYLAAAERMGAQLWTADEKLRNRAVQLGVSWVQWFDEST
jgi:predicted nucleic acid-binding protein